LRQQPASSIDRLIISVATNVSMTAYEIEIERFARS
jgi:hypothetical protein